MADEEVIRDNTAHLICVFRAIGYDPYFGKKLDLELMDGKKWQCSKEAALDSMYSQPYPPSSQPPLGCPNYFGKEEQPSLYYLSSHDQHHKDDNLSNLACFYCTRLDAGFSIIATAIEEFLSA
uniref:Uncharacterized protein n=1 Tax=Oryza punctata TaxID=4537 RepID=A0A0E0KP13_ORYPU